MIVNVFILTSTFVILSYKYHNKVIIIQVQYIQLSP